ncbi:MAG: type IV pilus secretin PilQ, partial [Deltaproteobacteria bacterium]|nr:type IV pilus secretin PilQ [Deltaproteobacteria bacterium]
LHLGIILFSLIVIFAACASQNAAKGKAAGETKLITDIITGEDAESISVTVKGNQTLTYTAIKQVFPLGVLFHFPETTLENIKTVHYPPDNEFISSIRATQIQEDGYTSRIFIALKKDLSYNIAPDTAGLSIVFPKTGKPIAETPAGAPDREEAESERMLETGKPELKPTAESNKAETYATPVPKKKPAQPASRLTSIAATPHKENVVINVKADGTITHYKSFTISTTPPRIVYDIYKLKSPFKAEQRIAVKSDQVSKIRHFGHPDKIRIVLETKNAYLSKYSDTPVGNGLVIYIGQAPTSASNEKPKAVVTRTAQSMPPSPKEPMVAQKSQTVRYDNPAWLNRIDFASEEAGKSTIIVGTSRPVEYQITKFNEKRVQLKLLDTNLPEYRKRALITTRFQSAVDRITPTYAPKSKDTVIDIELREGVPYFVKQSDDVIRVHFAASSIPPRPYEDAKLPAWKNVMAEPVDKTAAEVSAGRTAKPAPGLATGSPAKMTAKAEALPSAGEALSSANAKKELSLAERLNSGSQEQKYTGEKISLDFYDTDIKNVFRIIREISGKNFAIDKNVTGKVTLALDKPVPWDQVLDLVLKMNQLGMKMEGDIIRIATLSSLAQEEKLRQAQLKATQQAAEQQKALEPLVTAYIPVSYSNAQSEILPHIQPVMTEGRGKASVDTRNNQLILTDTAEKIAQIREIVRKIDQVTPQVIIEARIVEANTSFTRDLGFDWGAVSAGPFDIGSSQLTLRGVASNLPATNPSGVVGFDFVKLTGTPFSIIDAKLVVSETEGKTNIISAPKVVTLDNKKAKIKQGLEVPYLERDSSGNATVRFKNVDLLLEVTPNVTPDDRIVMKIFVTKNDVAEQTQDGPALATNEAETELLIEDGDTIVIGGIVKSSITYAEKGLPGLRNIGVLGWLFKSQSKTDSKNELLIFITPRIVQLKQKSGTSI